MRYLAADLLHDEMNNTGREEIDRLISTSDFSSLPALSAIICSAPTFDAAGASYGLPGPIFLFVEGLLWLSQSLRSGTWTYFESTPLERQKVMLGLLVEHAPEEYSRHYATGMNNWRVEGGCREVDDWMIETEEEWNRWLGALPREHRTALHSLFP